MSNPTKNDRAWESLFDKYSILESINQNSYFKIKSSQINEFRESRLMAKFDHSMNLPHIFKENQLSILPISRSEYIIGHFKTHYDLSDSSSEIIAVHFPDNIQSINSQNLYSESIALNCAFISGMINELLENEDAFQTISGRMSTGCFDFKINNILDLHSPYDISVNHSQCEIDAGFESDHYLMLVEAKNYAVDNFLIRQLYYPYRLWKSRVSKEVIPVLMTFSNDIFSFYIFQFNDLYSYNSIQLITQQNFKIESEPISLDDINDIYNNIRRVEEPENIPFPQADKMERVIDLLGLLLEKNLTKEEITENYQFDVRQTDYYTNAGRYLGLIDKSMDTITKEVIFQLTDEARKILIQNHKQRYLSLIKMILSHEVFYKAFEMMTQLSRIPSKQEIVSLMTEINLLGSDSTKGRRAGTVRSWLEWICSQATE